MKKTAIHLFLAAISCFLFLTSNCKAQAGAALNFAGASGTAVNIGNSISTALYTKNTITVEAWVNSSSIATLGVIAGNYYTAGANQMQFLLRRDGNSFAFWVNCGSGYQSVTSAGSTALLNTWQHVAGVWNGSSLFLYIDGVLMGTTNFVNGPDFVDIADPVLMGNNSLGETFTGSLDEVRIWDHVRTQCQIQAGMNCEVPAPATGLMAYYKMNQGIAGGANPSVTIAADASGNGRNGTLSNFSLTGPTTNWVSPGGVTSGVSCNMLSVNQSTGILTGGTATLTASGATSYLWSTGATTASISVSPATTTSYTVTGSNGSGCSFSSVATVNVASALGSALHFAAGDDKVIVPDNVLLDFGTTDFTVEASIRTSASNPNYAGIVVKADGAMAGYQLVLVNNQFAAEFGNGSVFLGTGSGLLTTTLLNDGNWHRLAMVVSRSNNNIKLIVDGNVEANVINSAISTTNVNNAVPMYMGTERGQSAFYQGNIDEVRIWNRALCQSEIQNNLNAELTAGQSGLVAYYKFNEGYAAVNNLGVTTLTDIGGNNLDGMLTNLALSGSTSNWIAPGSVVTGSGTPTFVSPVVSATGPVTAPVCAGNPNILTASGSSSYFWTPAANLDNATLASPTATPPATTVYSVTSGCIGGNTATATVNVIPTPIAVINEPSGICIGATVSLTVSDAMSSGGPYTYSWSDGSTSAGSNTITPGTYSVTITNGSACSSSASKVFFSAPVSVTSTGGTGAPELCYATLKAGFDAINAGIHTGVVAIQVKGNTTETATCVLNASGTGASSYTAISIQPSGGSARTITGNLGAPLIDLQGASNMTIDGLNAGGNSITFSNLNSISAATTIRFINDASNNTITNCSVLGSCASAAGLAPATISFSTANLTGNDNNTISYCNIGPAIATLPSKAIYLGGTTGKENDGIVIDHNNIYDYFRTNINNSGIELNAGTNGTTISNNKFYQTAPRTFPVANIYQRAININNTTGGGYSILNNTIGFANSSGTGTSAIVFGTATIVSSFVPIYINTGTVTASSVQGNIITNISVTGNSGGLGIAAPFKGIYVQGGLVSIGDISGNTIGSMSSTGSITYTSTNATQSDIIGILYTGTGNCTISNNAIGGITVASGTSTARSFYGIRSLATSGTMTCNNNTVGGTVANSIQITAANNGCYMYGIHNNASSGTYTGNTIRNMSNAGSNVGTGTTAAVAGICIPAGVAQTISQNTIANLSAVHTFALTTVSGIALRGADGNLVERNFIYNLNSNSNSTTAQVNGIAIVTTSALSPSTFQNNMIAIGPGANAITVSGIRESGGINNFRNNSIYISGTPTAGVGSSIAFNNTHLPTLARSTQNNIFVNAVSNNGATGKNYIVTVQGTAPNPAGLTINNNLYYGTGTGNIFGLFNSADVVDLAAWQAAVGQDANSFTGDPLFIAPAATPPNLHISTAGSVSPTEAAGVDLGVINDFDGQTRASLTPVDIGADAFLVCTTPIAGINGTTTICANSSATVTFTGTANATVYYHANSGAAQSIVLNGSGTNTLTHTFTADSIYTVDSVKIAICRATITGQSAVITVNNLPSVSISGTTTICEGTSTTLTAAGADTYAWTSGPASADNTVAPTTNTSYTVTGTITASGCTNTATQLVTVNAVPVVSSVSSTSVTCNGGTNGSATVVASGSGTLTYSWATGGATTATAGGLAAGTYTCTITDPNSCITTQTVSIAEPSAITVILASQTPVSCNGGSNGAASVTASGGTGTLTYNWTPGNPMGEGTNAVTGLTAGVWTCTVTDMNSCTSTQLLPILQPAEPVSGSTIVSNVFCFGESTASINLIPAGGTPGYTFNWGGGITTEDLTGVAAGTYTVLITDFNLCTGTVTVAVTQPAAPISGSTVATNVSCFGGSNGAINLTAAGGSGTYTYNWGSGITTEDRTGLAQGTYSVVITDIAGCTGTATATVTQPAAPVSGTTVVTQVSCFGGSNGTINLTPAGGTGAYTFNWLPSGPTTEDRTGLVAGTYSVQVTDVNGCVATVTATVTQPTAPVSGTTVVTNVSCFGGSNGTINLTPAGGTGAYTFNWLPSGPTTEDRTGLTAGTYTVIITDANGCTGTHTATVTQPTAPVSGSALVTNVSCFGGSNGSIDLTPTGGTAGYTYNWGSSITTQDRTGLAAGTYTVIITDANGCTGTHTATVTQPTAPVSGSALVTNVSCFGGSNGSIDLTPTGGTAGYTYNWGSSITTQDRTGLTAGTYTVIITDANGCTGTHTATVSSPSALSASSTSSPVLCNGGNSVVTVSATGGTAAYTGTGTFTVTAGTYTYTVNDANGCTATTNITVSQPTTLSALSTSTPVLCNGGTSVVTVSATGGTSAYTGTGTFTVTAGTYTYTVTDANGCTATTNSTVNEPTLLSASSTSSPVLCNGGTSVVTVSANGGTGAYTGIGAFTETAGTYTYTVSDANGCSANTTITINEPTLITSSTSSTSSNCGSANGSATVSASGGTGTLVYSWAPAGGNAATANGLSSGSYTVSITDDNGCVATNVASVSDIGAPVVSSTQLNVSCHGGTNGSIDNTVTGGTGVYTFSWSNSAITEDMNTLSADIYTYTVTDGAGCSATGSVTITEPDAITIITVSQTDVSCFGDANGAVSVSATGGTGALSFNWTPGNPTGNGTATITGLTAGIYTCTVSDDNSCIGTTTITIAEPAAALAASSTATSVLCNGGTADVTVSATGGTPAYTGTGAFPGVTAGTYSYTVTDANGCTAATTITVNEPALLTAASTATLVLCNGGTAVVSVSANGGTGAYAGAGTFTVTAGNYTYTVTDDNNCSATTGITISEPTAITSSVSATNSNCGSSNGSATVVATGGTGTLVYAWMPTGGNAAAATGLSAGSYTVSTTDDNGCTITDVANVSDIGAPSVSNTQTDVSCHGQADGSIDNTISGGTGTYTFSWSNSANTEDVNMLVAGVYSYTVTDVAGCSGTGSVTITEPGAIDVSTTVAGTVISANNTGAASYQWIDCSTNLPIAGETNQTYTAIANGDYAVIISEGACSDTSACEQIAGIGIRSNNTGSAGLISVYPNPGLGIFYVKSATSSKASVFVYDSKGSLILEKETELNASSPFQLNIYEQEAGVYFVRVITDAIVQQFKIVKE
ncbi:MAG: hypothetical protein K0S33_4067 [Bacteroidetes bacterium]|jgi:hypothetical protein|nr:hypothetical protein [Bacteroidota bacterium]